MPKYIEVTQDGCARLIRGKSPADIEGIYTDGLLSCIAIIIVGDEGISLIHDTGRLSVESILREFGLVGNVLYWTIAFNPIHHPGGLKKQIDRFHKGVIDKVGAGKHVKISSTDRGVKLYKAEHAFVSIDLVGNINVATRPATVIFPRNIDERHHLINVVNSWFLGGEEEINVDIQFDGSNFTDMPRLNKTHSEISQLIETPKFLDSERLVHTNKLSGRFKIANSLFQLLNKYKLATENLLPLLELAIQRALNTSLEDHKSLIMIKECVDTIKMTDEICFRYKLMTNTPSDAELARALRQAVSEGSIRDVQFLIGKVKDINVQDNNPERRRTALHWAVIKCRKENVSALLAAGAKDDIPDAAGKTANNYAMQSADEEMKSLFQAHASATFSH